MIKSFEATLTKRTELTHDINLFNFEIVNDTLQFLAGQYVIMLITFPDGTVARRLYSISSESQNTKSFDLLVKRIPGGMASNYLAGLPIGGKVSFQGPAGVFSMKDSDPTKSKVFLATSTGIAPIYSMLRSRILDGVTNEKWYLFWGARTKNDLHWVKELEEMRRKNPSFKYSFCLSRESDPSQKTMPPECALGRIDASFQNDILESVKGNTELLNGYEYYICGSINAVETLRQSLIGEGVEKKNIRSEKFI